VSRLPAAVGLVSPGTGGALVHGYARGSQELPGSIETRITWTGAVIVAAASLGGAAYVSRASADDTAVVSRTGIRLAGVDLSARTGSRESSGHMLTLAYERVESQYYKPFDDQTLLSGERKALVAFLKSRKVANPSLPARLATGNRNRDLALLQSELTVAQQTYPKAATQDEFTQVAISGMLSSLGDPYTTYMSKNEIRGLEEQLAG